jgi:DsbC/DsbD-like thiol-disulfide interchange protein
MSRSPSVPASLAALALLASVPTALAADGWTATPNSRARLVWCGGATGPAASAGTTELAYFELEMAAGWKTYWRNPGEAGVPPSFDWAASRNLAKTLLHFPAPHRLPDQGGESIGYKTHVVLPVAITRTDPKQPVALTAAASFGVCKNICVPIDVTLAATCPAGSPDSAQAAAVEAVPRAPGQRRPTDPELLGVSGSVVGTPPKLIFDVAFGAGAADTDLFIEAPEGLYVPLPPQATPDASGRARYTLDLSKTPDLPDLVGKPLRLTLRSTKGASEAIWVAK